MKLAATLLLLTNHAYAASTKCDVSAQSDLTNDERVTDCSTLQGCWADGKYQNAKCTDRDESCGKWTDHTQPYNGCILT